MAVGNFEKALARVLVYEGGNDDDPRDPGGRTSRGIIQREYNVYRRNKNLPTRDVWQADQSEIIEIYKINYWDRMHCDDLPDGVDLVVFDGGVNSGIGQQAKWCQRSCPSYIESGAQINGDFGPATVRALRNQPDNDLLIAEILSRRLAMLQGLKGWKYYGKGWSARVANVKKIGQAWATGSVGPSPVAVADLGGHKKAKAQDVKEPIISVQTAQVTTVATTTSTAATQAVGGLTPYADTIDIIKYVCAGLTVVAVIAGLLVTILAKRSTANKEGEAKAEVDDGADLELPPVKLPAAAAAASPIPVLTVGGQ